MPAGVLSHDVNDVAARPRSSLLEVEARIRH